MNYMLFLNPGFVSGLCFSAFNFIMCPFAVVLLEKVNSPQKLQCLVMCSIFLSLHVYVCVVFPPPFLSYVFLC